MGGEGGAGEERGEDDRRGRDSGEGKKIIPDSVWHCRMALGWLIPKEGGHRECNSLLNQISKKKSKN